MLLNKFDHVLTSSMVVLILILFLEAFAELSLFPFKDRLSHSLRSKVVFKKASCRDCNVFCIGKKIVDYMTGEPNILILLIYSLT